jgi:ribose 5-phosphate isomerase A
MKWRDSLASDIGWHREISNLAEKKRAAKKLAQRLNDGDIVGVGSGSTSYLTLLALAKRRDDENLSFSAIAASKEMEMICAALSVPLTTLLAQRPDWSFDGADEVDKDNNVIKGRGGALLREKLLIEASPEVYIVIDPSKRVKRLGQNFPVPVEVHPEAIQLVETSLSKVKGIASVALRQVDGKDGPLITEGGNFLLDVTFSSIAPGMEKTLKAITGVVETGLFMGYTFKII